MGACVLPISLRILSLIRGVGEDVHECDFDYTVIKQQIIEEYMLQ